jgi:hypothetical protein
MMNNNDRRGATANCPRRGGGHEEREGSTSTKTAITRCHNRVAVAINVLGWTITVARLDA